VDTCDKRACRTGSSEVLVVASVVGGASVPSRDFHWRPGICFLRTSSTFVAVMLDVEAFPSIGAKRGSRE